MKLTKIKPNKKKTRTILKNSKKKNHIII